MRTLLISPRLEGKCVAAVRLRDATYVAGPVHFAIPPLVPLAGAAALLALARLGIYQSLLPNTTAEVVPDPSPKDICGALLPLGISTGEWARETAAEVVEAIHDRGRTETGTPQMRVSAEHHCELSALGARRACRSTIRIRNAAATI